MSKERALLEKILATGWLNNTISCEVEELLAQPEQEVKVGIYDDIFSDYEYLVTAFKNGANADDYSSDIGRAFSDIRKARNWLCPLPKHVID